MYVFNFSKSQWRWKCCGKEKKLCSGLYLLINLLYCVGSQQ